MKKFLWLILLISFLGISFWVLFLSNYTEIKKVEIKSEKINQKRIEEIFDRFKNEKYFDLIPKNNFFLFPRNTFSDSIKKEFELIRGVDFKNNFPGFLEIEISEREAVAIWCNQDKCFLIDEQGFIFREVAENEKEERFKDYLIIKDDSFREGVLGNKIENHGLAVFVSNIKDSLKKELDINMKRELFTPSLLSEEVRVETAEGWKIYFSLKRDVDKQIFLLKKVFNGELENSKNLEYIDLRAEGKVIYKTKD